MRIGDVVQLKRGCLHKPIGTLGIVFAKYNDGPASFSVIFEGGVYDGFSEREQDLCFTVIGHNDSLSGYTFIKGMYLIADFKKGIFDPVFKDKIYELPKTQEEKMKPEEKYNITYQDENYRRDSIGPKYVPFVLDQASKAFDTVLDVGCGMAGSVKLFKQAGKTAIGIESCTYLLENHLKDMVDDLTVRKGRIQELPFEDNSFDLVFCTDVLEHIVEEDIAKSLSELVRVTRKLIFVTIATRRAVYFSKLELHETVQPKEWWDKMWAIHNLPERVMSLPKMMPGQFAMLLVKPNTVK